MVLANGYQPSEQLKKELIDYTRVELGPIMILKDIVFVDMLPKTRSGKIMRRVVRALLMKEELGDISAIEEEASVDEIREALRKIGEHQS